MRFRLSHIGNIETFVDGHAELLDTAAYHHRRVAELVDFVMPKHYYWQRVHDGPVGTDWRWVSALTEWNPGPSVRDACIVLRTLAGESIPVFDDLVDLDRLITRDLAELATREARRAAAAIGDRACIVPGRLSLGERHTATPHRRAPRRDASGSPGCRHGAVHLFQLPKRHTGRLDCAQPPLRHRMASQRLTWLTPARPPHL